MKDSLTTRPGEGTGVGSFLGASGTAPPAAPTGNMTAEQIADEFSKEEFERLGVPLDEDEPLDADTAAPTHPWIYDLNRFREERRTIIRTRLSTKIPTLDKATKGGISGGMVITLTGPPGSCKTVLASQLACDRARALGGRVWVYAPDQGGAQYLERLAATVGDIAEDDEAFSRFVAEAGPLLAVIDERQSGVSVEGFVRLVLAAGAVAAVVIDTPQVVRTEEDKSDSQRVDLAMDSAVKIATTLTVPVFVCNHANRAATAARNKKDRTLARSAGLHSVAIEHRSQVNIFMEKRARKDGVTEIDAEIPKAPISHLELRLVLDPGSWTLREIDFADETEEKAEHVKKEKESKRNLETGERRTAIMAVIQGGPTKEGVSFARLFGRVGGRDATLRNQLAIMCEEHMLEELDGPMPTTGGNPPTHWRLYDPSSPIPPRWRAVKAAEKEAAARERAEARAAKAEKAAAKVVSQAAKKPRAVA